jgi:hypothetical protein
MEKSLLDYFYSNSDVSTPADFESRRFNKEVFLEQLDKIKLSKYLERFNQKRLSARITTFITWCKHD